MLSTYSIFPVSDVSTHFRSVCHLHVLAFLPMCLIKHIYIQWQLQHQTFSAWGMRLSNPPASLLSVDLVALKPQGRHFLFSCWHLDPPPRPIQGPLAEAPCYLLPRELRESTQHGWLNKGATCCSLAHKTHIRSCQQTRTRTHGTVTWWSQGRVGWDVYRCSNHTTHSRPKSRGWRGKQGQSNIHKPRQVTCR